MQKLLRLAVCTPCALVCCVLTACGGGGSSADDTEDQSIGGIWTGKDTDGNDLVALVTESGEFRFLDVTSGFQGSGVASVTNGSDVTVSYTEVAPLGDTLEDGGVSATCSGTGTLEERETLTLDITCRSNLGTTWTQGADLDYDATYERASSLATIAGLYDDDGNVMSIDKNGAIFEQWESGCVFNGHVSIIDSEWNAYAIAFSVSNCQGTYTSMNGSSWDGMATLAVDGTTNTLVLGVTGKVQGTTFSVVASLPKI